MSPFRALSAKQKKLTADANSLKNAKYRLSSGSSAQQSPKKPSHIQ